MKLNDVLFSEMSLQELQQTDGGNWYYWYQIFRLEMEDFIKGFKEAHDY